MATPKLCRLFSFDAAPVSCSPKIHYFWRIRHAAVDIFEESEQYSSALPVCLSLISNSDHVLKKDAPEALPHVLAPTSFSTQRGEEVLAANLPALDQLVEHSKPTSTTNEAHIFQQLIE